jgi:hypothetical protein
MSSVTLAEITAGHWNGSLINNLDKRYDIKYIVSYEDADDLNSIQIKMVNLDLEPTPDYTYQLEAISFVDDVLTFKIPREHDVHLCELKFDDEEFVGKCSSNKAKGGEVNQISMIPILPE